MKMSSSTGLHANVLREEQELEAELTLGAANEEDEGVALKNPSMRSSRGSLTDSAISSSAPSSLASSTTSSRSNSPVPTEVEGLTTKLQDCNVDGITNASSNGGARTAKVIPTDRLSIPSPSPSECSDSGGSSGTSGQSSTTSSPPPSEVGDVPASTYASLPNRFAQLTYEQVKKLEAVLEEVVPVHGRGNFPTLEVKLKDLVRVVRSNLEKDSIHVRDIRLNGGATSHILSTDSQPYNDLDVIFSVDLSTPRAFDKVKGAVLDSLLDFMPDGVCKKRIGGCILKEAYVHKMVKVAPRDLNHTGKIYRGRNTIPPPHPNGDRWSLISLSNNRGRNIELKFVDTMRRQFEFSVDSFQIVLDSLLAFYGCTGQVPLHTENFYPTVLGESVYGDFAEAFYHLEEKLIATRRPEEIRGGGLLKYCHLLVKSYVPARPKEIKNLERYMCSRFFIDFGHLAQQRAKLEGYLTNHFVGDARLRCEYLATLYRVVDESTICLMGQERRQTLSLIEEMAYRVYFMEQQRIFATRCQQQQLQQPQDLSGASRRYLVNGGFFYTPYMPTTGYGAVPANNNVTPSISGNASNNSNTNGSNCHCSTTWVNYA